MRLHLLQNRSLNLHQPRLNILGLTLMGNHILSTFRLKVVLLLGHQKSLERNIVSIYQKKFIKKLQMATKRLWVARDLRACGESSRLYLYSKKPRRHKKDGCFYTSDTFAMPIPEKLLPGVTWENSPKELKNVLGYSNRLQAYDIS